MPNPHEEEALARKLFRRLQIVPEDLVIRDRPDVCFHWADKKIGLEITQADAEEYRRVEQLPNEASCIFPGNLHDERPSRRSTSELQAEVLNPHGPWQNVGEVIDRWSRAISRAYTTKLEKLARPGLAHFDENWLLIAGITGPGDNEIDLRLAHDALARELGSVAQAPPIFDKVYIHFDCYLYEFESRSLRFNYSD